MSSNLNSLHRRINLMLEQVKGQEQPQHLPMVYYYSASGKVVSGEEHLARVWLPMKVYIDLDPDEDGCEP